MVELTHSQTDVLFFTTPLERDVKDAALNVLVIDVPLKIDSCQSASNQQYIHCYIYLFLIYTDVY